MPVSVRVRTCTTAAELQRSLEIYNEVWPHSAVTAADVDAWKTAAIASIEFLGALDGVDAGSAAAALEAVAHAPRRDAAHRARRNIGGQAWASALLEAVMSWAAEQGAEQIETRVEADDRASLEFALRRGFHEHSREDGLELTLSDVEPPQLDPPARVEIVTLAERPELARGVYEVAAEALPDVPGSEDWLPPPFEQFASSHLRGLVIFVALADGEAIGYAKLVGRPDGRTADHGITAVRREWRRRGVAQTLKRAQIAWAKNARHRTSDGGERRAQRADAAHQFFTWISLGSWARAPARARRLIVATLDARMSRGLYVVALAIALALAAPIGAAAPSAHASQQSECLRATFYSPADWLRLATKLAAHNVSCAQYYVTIPPLAAEKTTFRPDQPWRIRALGKNFHAVAEISYNGWSRWIAANGSSWYDAGVEARKRMAAQGFDVAAGDTWAINESSSAVSTGAGVARQNLRDLVRGLYTGAGGTAVKGIVFVVGVGQTGTSLSTVQGNAAALVRRRGVLERHELVRERLVAGGVRRRHEVRGRRRNAATFGATSSTRGSSIRSRSRTPRRRTRSRPRERSCRARTARSRTRRGATAQGSGFGGTDVPTAVMQDYVSAQVYAMRSAGTRLGFAWTPKRPEGESSTQFASESGALLDRLATAIHDSASAPEAACVGTCAVSLAGAAFNEGWQDFATWSPAELEIATPAVTAVTGTAAGPLTVRLKLAGIVRPDTQPVTVTLTSSSAQASFATTPDGVWSPTLSLVIPVGSTDASFYYRDATAGSPSIGVSAPGRVGDEQVETIVAPAKPATPPKPKPVPTVRVVKVAYAQKHGKLSVALTTVDARRQRVAQASVRLALRRNGRWYGAVSVQHDCARCRRLHTPDARRLLLRERRARAGDGLHVEQAHAEERLLREDFSSRSICLAASRFAMSRRLSRCSLPRASATSTLTLPSLK